MDKIFSTKDRILHFLENKGIKKADFFKDLEISASNFKGVGLKSELGGDKLVKILQTYTELSAEWLLRGTGPMLLDNTMSVAAEPIVTYNRKCHSCSEKDILIREKTERISELKEMIELLKESSKSKRDSA